MKKILAACLLLFSSTLWAGTVTVEDAYVRHMPPTQSVTGAFMLLKNGTDQTASLVSAESDVSEKVELHSHVHEDGMMKMREVENIDIPAGGETALQPGGFHIMLIGLKQPLEMGQKVSITLNFADGSSTQVQAEVRSVMSEMQGDAKPTEHAGKGMEHAGKSMEK